MIAGNHDNARRLRAVAPVFEFGRVHVVAEPIRPDDGGVLQLRARDGTDVRVAMLPFVSKRGIVRAEHLMEGEGFENAQAYTERLALVIDALCRQFHSGTVSVLAAHAFVLGAVSGGGERAAHLVDEFAVTSQSFPATIGYAALGHLHRPQRIPGATPLHYCGSPLQLDFGETEQTKQVNVMHIEPGTPADVVAISLVSGRALRTVVGTIDELETRRRANRMMRGFESPFEDQHRPACRRASASCSASERSTCGSTPQPRRRAAHEPSTTSAHPMTSSPSAWPA